MDILKIYKKIHEISKKLDETNFSKSLNEILEFAKNESFNFIEYKNALIEIENYIELLISKEMNEKGVYSQREIRELDFCLLIKEKKSKLEAKLINELREKKFNNEIGYEVWKTLIKQITYNEDIIRDQYKKITAHNFQTKSPKEALQYYDPEYDNGYTKRVLEFIANSGEELDIKILRGDSKDNKKKSNRTIIIGSDKSLDIISKTLDLGINKMHFKTGDTINCISLKSNRKFSGSHYQINHKKGKIVYKKTKTA